PLCLARRSAIRRPTRTISAIAGTSVPISSVDVSREGSNWLSAVLASTAIQLTASMATSAVVPTSSSRKNTFARRRPISKRRHQRGERFTPALPPPTLVPHIQHRCCTSARKFCRSAGGGTIRKSDASDRLVRMDAQFGQTFAQGVAIDPQQVGRSQLVSAGSRQGMKEQRLLESGQPLIIESAGCGTRSLQPVRQRGGEIGRPAL
ncbi:hypothetical protein OY671_009097, partial [Metschnikowia pulcherrima]